VPACRDDVAAVELRAHLYGQLALSQRLGRIGEIRCTERKVAAEGDEDLHVSAVHRLDRRDSAEAVLARRLESADFGETIEKGPTRGARRSCTGGSH
jgi:hypothetical protein